MKFSAAGLVENTRGGLCREKFPPLKANGEVFSPACIIKAASVPFIFAAQLKPVTNTTVERIQV